MYITNLFIIKIASTEYLITIMTCCVELLEGMYILNEPKTCMTLNCLTNLKLFIGFTGLGGTLHVLPNGAKKEGLLTLHATQ